MELEKLIDRNAYENLTIDKIQNLSFDEKQKLIDYVFTFSCQKSR